MGKIFRLRLRKEDKDIADALDAMPGGASDFVRQAIREKLSGQSKLEEELAEIKRLLRRIVHKLGT